MPMPWTYRHASREFRAFLDDAKNRMCLESDNSTYTAVDAVFQVFRRRLTVQQGLDFASVLPSNLRAIFVADWKIEDPPLPFTGREALTSEAKRVRRHHNLTPDNAIEATAWSIRRCVDQRDFDRVLACLSPEARDFWKADAADPAELKQRIV